MSGPAPTRVGPALPGAAAVSWSPRPDTSGLLNLKSCELQTPAAEALLREVVAELSPVDLWRYPYQQALAARLAADEGLDPARVMLTAGSNAAIGAVVDALAVPRGALLLQEPIFESWEYFATLRGVPATRCPGVVGSPPRTTLDAFEHALHTSPPAVAVLTNPGNPLGDLVPLPAVRRLVELAAERGHLLVVDDCYGSFAGTGHAGLTADHDAVLVLSSLSKTWGLAGARLATVFGSPPLIDYLQRFRLDSAVSAPALAVATGLHERAERLREVRRDVLGIRAWFVAEMARARPGWFALPGVTNFVTFATGVPGGGDRAERLLARHRIRVRSVESMDGLTGCVRISLAGRDALARVVEVLAAENTAGSIPAAGRA